MQAAIFGLGPLEFLIIVIVLVVLFLPSQLPRIMGRISRTFGSIRDMADRSIEEEEGKDTGEP